MIYVKLPAMASKNIKPVDNTSVDGFKIFSDSNWYVI